MLTERVNKRHCGIEGEEKPTSVLDGEKNRAEKKKQKKKQISKPPQHMETGSEKEEVLTGCPCGGCCLSTGLRMEVCVCNPYGCLYMCFVCLQMCVC